MEIFNKKKLAAKLGVSLPTLYKLLEEVLRDDDVKKEFGNYKFKRFNKKQIEIIERETGFKILNTYDP